MAKINLDLIIKDAEAASTVDEVKQQLKQLKNALLGLDEGTEEFNRAAAAAARLKERIEDAGEAIGFLNPDAFDSVANFAGKAAAGVSIVTGAMGLLGTESEETEKMLLKVQAAMAFAQGIQGIKDITKAFRGLAAVVAANPLGAFLVALTAISAAAYKMYQSFNEAGKESVKLAAQLEKQKDITSQLVAIYENQITILEAQGGQEEKIFELKKKALEQRLIELELSAKMHRAKITEVIDNNSVYESLLELEEQALRKIGMDKEADQVAALLQVNKKERAQEDLDAYKQEVLQIEELRTAITALEISEDNRKHEAWKKNSEERKAKAKQDAEDEKALLDEVQKRRMEQEKWNEESEQQDYLNWKAIRDQKIQDAQDLAEVEQLLADENRARLEEGLALEKKIAEMKSQFLIDSIRSVMSIAGGLAKKNAKLQKHIAAGSTLIETFLSAQKAFTSQLLAGDPTSVIRAGIAAGLTTVAGLARVREIYKVDESGASATSSASASSIGGGSISFSSNPNVNTSQQPTTFLNQQGQIQSQQQQQPIYVSVTEIREKMDNVQTMEDRSVY